MKDPLALKACFSRTTLLTALAGGLVLIGFARPCNAGVNAALGIDGSTYPLLATELTGELGYEWVFWEAAEDRGDPDRYRLGVVHPFLDVANSVAYQSVGGAIEIYPIAFWSLQAGLSWQHNSSQHSGYDCETFQCKGEITDRFFETALEGQRGRLSGDLRFHRDIWRPSLTTRPATIDPTSGMLLGRRERQNNWTASAAWRLSAHWQTFSTVGYIESLDRPGATRVAVLGGNFVRDHLALNFGTGVFDSPLKPTGVTLFVQLTWHFKPGLRHGLSPEETQTESKLR